MAQASSSGASARSATMRRLWALEAELATARRERQALEDSVGRLRHSLSAGLPSPTSVLGSGGALSPRPAWS